MIDEGSMIVGTKTGGTFNLKFDKKNNEYEANNIYSNDKFNQPQEKKNNKIWNIQHMNQSDFIIFNDSDELKKIISGNNVIKTLGKMQGPSEVKLKKFYGKMFKLDKKKEWIYWKKANNEIQRLSLKSKEFSTFTFPLKKEDDFVIDFDLDERNESLYALSHKGEILLRCYSLKNPMGPISLYNASSSENHLFTSLKISSDDQYMAIGGHIKSEKNGEKNHEIQVQAFMLMENGPTRPKLKYLDEKTLIPVNLENEKVDDYIQCLDFGLKHGKELYLTVYLRKNSEVQTLKIEDKQLKGPIFEKIIISAEFIKDISRFKNKVYICFNNSSEIGELNFKVDCE